MSDAAEAVSGHDCALLSRFAAAFGRKPPNTWTRVSIRVTFGEYRLYANFHDRRQLQFRHPGTRHAPRGEPVPALPSPSGNLCPVRRVAPGTVAGALAPRAARGLVRAPLPADRLLAR